MTPSPADQQRGILLLVGAVFLFSLMDATAKHLAAQGYPPLQIVWVRLAVNLALVVAIFAPRLHNIIRTTSPGLQFARGVTQVGTVALFFLSLRHIGLAEATALTDLNPMLITLGAAIFLGEKIGPRRLIGIGAALVGALIVLRPGLSVFQPAALLPLLAAFTYAAGAIITRKVRGDSTATSVLWGTGVATGLASLSLPFVWTPIAAGDLWAFALLGMFGTLAQVGLIRAFATAEASTLAPFGYTGLVWAGVWGWLFFGTLPDAWVVLGALVIVGAGLYVWHREAQDRRRDRPE